jgi:hypothetical protein
MKILGLKAAVYVPSDIRPTYWRKIVLPRMVELFGVATAIEALGCWRHPNGINEYDPKRLVYSFTDQETLQKNRPAFIRLVTQVGKDLAQHTMAFELDGQLYLVETSELLQEYPQ